MVVSEPLRLRPLWPTFVALSIMDVLELILQSLSYILSHIGKAIHIDRCGTRIHSSGLQVISFWEIEVLGLLGCMYQGIFDTIDVCKSCIHFSAWRILNGCSHAHHRLSWQSSDIAHTSEGSRKVSDESGKLSWCSQYPLARKRIYREGVITN